METAEVERVVKEIVAEEKKGLVTPVQVKKLLSELTQTYADRSNMNISIAKVYIPQLHEKFKIESIVN